MVIQMIGNDFYHLKKDVVIFYKTVDMEKPKFLYQESPSKYPGLVAVMAQFLPTFESQVMPQKQGQQLTDATDVTCAGSEKSSKDITENGVAVKL